MKDNCLCGHTRGSHFNSGDCNARKPIVVKGTDTVPEGIAYEFCRCQKYKRDNLKYLERLSESKSNGK